MINAEPDTEYEKHANPDRKLVTVLIDLITYLPIDCFISPTMKKCDDFEIIFRKNLFNRLFVQFAFKRRKSKEKNICKESVYW